MSGVILVAEGSQRMDLTCRMKDADRVLQEMEKNHVEFDKKYTTLRGRTMASTITFVNIRASEIQKDLTTLISSLNGLAGMNQIGNVYVNFQRTDTPAPVRKFANVNRPDRFGPKKSSPAEAPV